MKDYIPGSYKDMTYEERKAYLDACVEQNEYPLDFFKDMCRYIEDRCLSVVWFTPDENELGLWCPESFGWVDYIYPDNVFLVLIQGDQAYDDYIVDFYTFIDDRNLDKVNRNSPDVIHKTCMSTTGPALNYVSIRKEV